MGRVLEPVLDRDKRAISLVWRRLVRQFLRRPKQPDHGVQRNRFDPFQSLRCWV